MFTPAPNMTLSRDTGGRFIHKKLEKWGISHNLKASSMINLLVYLKQKNVEQPIIRVIGNNLIPTAHFTND